MIASHRFLVVLLIFGVHAIDQQLNVLPSVDQKKRTPETVASFTERKNKPRLEGAMLETVEKALLNSFGLKTRPRPTKKVHIPEYILELYKQHNGDEEDLSSNFNIRGKTVYDANTIRSFYDDEQSPFIHLYPEKHKTHFLFDVKTIENAEELMGAELRLYRERLDQPGGNSSSIKHRIDIYEILRPASETREAITRLLDTRTVGSNRTAWESFDVHPAVLKWTKSPHLNYGLEVHVTELSPPSSNRSDIPHVRLRRSTRDRKRSSNWEEKQPFLVAYSHDEKASKKSRTRRNSKYRSKRKSRTRRQRRKNRERLCQRRPLYVDFSDVGWNDWIVAPAGYQAYYCMGECQFPFADHMNATNHAIVQTLVNSVNPEAVPKACCVPTELSEISMLYLDEDEKVVLKKYSEMVVEGCGCR